MGMVANLPAPALPPEDHFFHLKPPGKHTY